MSTLISNRKNKLKRRGQDLRLALKEDFDSVKKQSRELISHGLIIVGVFTVGFILYKIMSSSSGEERYTTTNEDSKVMVVNAEPSNSLFKSIMSSIAIFLLNIAKDKLLEYMEERKNKGTVEE